MAGCDHFDIQCPDLFNGFKHELAEWLQDDIKIIFECLIKITGKVIKTSSLQ